MFRKASGFDEPVIHLKDDFPFALRGGERPMSQFARLEARSIDKHPVSTVDVVTSELQVLDAKDPGDSSLWDELVDRAPSPDVYYRPAYARLNESIDHGRAVALLISCRNLQALVPLLLRPLSDLPFVAGQPGFDAVTPYGYGGFLVTEGRAPSKADVPDVLDALRCWCKASRVISCHIRLHPLLEQAQWLDATPFEDRVASVCFRGLTTGIDLSRWDSANQRAAGMSDTRRRQLNRARRHLRVEWGGCGISMVQALKLFRQIYEHRMVQLHARAYYYFSEEYYAALSAQTQSAVALACLGDEVVGANLFLADRQFAHYHLGAANETGFEFNAPTLLTNAGGQWAWERGCKLLHLGGGPDGLLAYKRSYGGPIFRYHTLDVIADDSVYSSLAEKRLCCEALPPPRQGFFPEYRA